MKITPQKAIEQVGHLIDLWIPLKIAYGRVPGISIGITYKDKLIYKKGFGFGDITSKKKIDDRTNFRVASISKMFTATAIMQLVEHKKLGLDDKVADHISWFNTGTTHTSAQNITIRQLLSHAGGIFRDGDTPHWETGKFPKDLKMSFSTRSLIKENLTGFKYTNYGFALLGLVIEKVSGMKYDDYIATHILKKLNMKNTYADYTTNLKNNLATGYSRIMPNQTRHAFKHNPTYIYASATGFVSNVSDLTRFITASYRPNNKSNVLHSESFKEMRHPREKTQDGNEYGLGVEIEYMNNEKVIGHSGGFNGFASQMILGTKSHVGVVVLANANQVPTGSIAFGILDAVQRLINHPGDYTARKKILFNKYEGIYRREGDDEIIARAGDILVDFSPTANFPLKSGARLVPTAKQDTFISKDTNVFSPYDESVTFVNIKNGKAQKMFDGATPSKRVRTHKR